MVSMFIQQYNRNDYIPYSISLSMNKEVAVDGKGNIYDIKYRIKITWDEFGGIATGSATATAGSDKALKEFATQFEKMKKEMKMDNATYTVEKVE